MGKVDKISVTNPNQPESVAQLNIHLLDHCLFCMRKTITSGVCSDDNEVPEAVETPGLVSTFNLLWPYLLKQKGAVEDNTGPDFEEVMTGRSKCSGKARLSPSPFPVGVEFESLPTICQFCVDYVRQVGDLMKLIKAQMQTLENIIRETKTKGQFSWRLKEFKKKLKETEVDKAEINVTLEFVNGMRNCLPVQDDLAPPPCPRSKIRDLGRIVAVEPETVEEQFESPAQDSDQDCSAISASPEVKVENEKSPGSDPKLGSIFDEEEDDHHFDDDNDPDYIKSEVDDSDEEDDFFLSDDEDNATLNAEDSQNTEKEDPLSNPHSGADVPVSQSKKYFPAEKYTTCPAKYCGNTYLSKDRLRTHIKAFHSSKMESLLKMIEDIEAPEAEGQAPKRKRRKRGEEKVKFCDVCAELVPISKLLSHLRSHVGDYVVQCPNAPCPYICSNTGQLLLHRHQCRYLSSEERKKKPNHVCEACGFTTNQRLILKSHVQRVHERSPSKTFSCPLPNCGKVFAVRQSVDFHISTHNLRPVTQQKCELCEKNIPIEDISKHLEENHQVQEIISCRQCPCVFSTRLALVEHLYIHRYDGMSCDLCNNDVKYSRHGDLVGHYTEEHQLDCKQYICDVCAKKFFFKHTLTTHKLKSCSSTAEGTLSKDPKKFPCDLCFGSVTFSHESSLISHKIRVHGEDPFTCASCPKTFHSRDALLRHEKEHAGVSFQKKEFKCEVEGCGKVFNKNSGLQTHMVTHGVGGVKCDLCEKTFTSQGFKSHYDAVHLKLRPYVCDTCGEGFTSGSSLKRHKLVHTGDRPFACDLCGQKFRHKDVLNRHVESHERKGDAFKPMGPMKHIRKRKAQ